MQKDSSIKGKSRESRCGQREKTYSLVNFLRNNNFSVFHQRPMVNVGQKIKKGDILADTTSTVDGQISIGQNVFYGFFILVWIKLRRCHNYF